MADTKIEFTPPPEITGSAAWFRLDGQQRYYSARSSLYQDRYKQIKLGLIFISASIPILAFLPWLETARYVVAGSGVLIAVLEGILLLNRYGEHGITYRRTSEGLKRERALLLAEAGDYAGKDLKERLRLLAERTEALLDEENKQWQQQQAKAMEELAKTQEWTSKQVAAAAEAAKKPGA
jgi:Protein of unknown function (DUF4231)